MLAQIQRDIFELHDPTGGAPRPVAATDRSLQFHSCHSPMREMEVLHDQLLALFEEQPDLKPHDIVVMAPDISVYAPFIEAVFATAPEALRIPFSISDRGARAENGVIDTFLRILEAAGSRFTASSVLSILESVPLQRNFDLAEPDLEIIRTWIEETGIRWGIDAAHRAELGLPAFGENSWRAGLDRLLLGYAGARARRKTLRRHPGLRQGGGESRRNARPFCGIRRSAFLDGARRCSSRVRSASGRKPCARSPTASSAPMTSANRSCTDCDGSSIR